VSGSIYSENGGGKGGLWGDVSSSYVGGLCLSLFL
jgi:hypothetical protein